MTEVRNGVFAITGAASGIGRGLAVQVARAGGHVALSDVNEEGLRETAALCESHGAEIHHRVVDVADRDAVYAWADEVVDEFGRVNGIVNNAGVALRAFVEEIDLDDFRWLMDINFWGVVYGTRAFLPHLRKASEGHVVNISSVFGIMGIPTQAAYNASKFAVRGFTEALRQEMLVDKVPIGVTCVHPGGVQTNIVRNGRMRPMARYEDMRDVVVDFEERMARTSAEDAGKAILKGIQKNSARVLIGLDAKMMDKAQRMLPTGYQTFVAGLFRRQVEPKE